MGELGVGKHMEFLGRYPLRELFGAPPGYGDLVEKIGAAVEEARSREYVGSSDLHANLSSPWTKPLIDSALNLDRVWQIVACVETCVSVADFELEDLLGGRGQRRLDAAFDLLNTDFAASDVQASYFAWIEAARHGQLNTNLVRGLNAGRVAGAFGIAFVTGVSMGGAVNGATDWVQERLKNTNDFLLVMAQIALALESLGEDEAARPIIRQARENLGSILSALTKAQVRLAEATQTPGRSVGTDLNARQVSERMRVTTMVSEYATLLLGDEESSEEQSIVAPHLVGLTLKEARALLSAVGVDPHVVDCNGQRTPLLEGGWLVRQQLPNPAVETSIGGFVLLVAKQGELVPAKRLAKALEPYMAK